MCSSSLPTTIGASGQDFPLSTGWRTWRKNFFTEHISRITLTFNCLLVFNIRVAIPGIHVLMGYVRYYGSFVLQPQCVACSVAGVISWRDDHAPLGRPRRQICQLVSLTLDSTESGRISNTDGGRRMWVSASGATSGVSDVCARDSWICSASWIEKHLLLLFVSGPDIWQHSPPLASRYLTGSYSVVQCYGIYTVTCV